LSAVEFYPDERDAFVATKHGSVSSEAMREHLVQQGFDPADAAQAVQVWRNRPSLAGAHDPFKFRLHLGLPDDSRAMILDELDDLIAYHDSLCKRYDEALTRLVAVSDQIEATLRDYGGEVVGDLRGIDAARLREAWTEASTECNWCRSEVEAIGAYAEPLLEDEDD
jgi:hypothetical protein